MKIGECYLANFGKKWSHRTISLNADLIQMIQSRTKSTVYLLMWFLSPLLQSEMYVFYWMFWTSYCIISLLSQSGTVPHKSIQV